MGLSTRSLGNWQQCGLMALQAAMCGGIIQPISVSAAQPSSLRSYSTGGEQQRSPKIFAACVLERLPIVKSPPPEWEAEYKAWTHMRKANEGMIKQYPVLDRKQKSRDDGEQTQLNVVPTVTQVDQEGIANTMKRRLADKLVLLVKARQDPAAAAAASSTAAAAAEQGVWTFPWTTHKAGETIRDTAERALREAIGPSQVYFVGNAPMAHLELRSSNSSSSSSSSSSDSSGAEQQAPLENTAAAAKASSGSGSSAEQQAPLGAPGAAKEASSSSCFKKQRPDGRLFFHLATVVNDPWDVAVSDEVAGEHAWVNKDELPQYIKDDRLLALAHQML